MQQETQALLCSPLRGAFAPQDAPSPPPLGDLLLIPHAVARGRSAVQRDKEADWEPRCSVS